MSKKYLALTAIIILFAALVGPKIVERIRNNTTVDGSRLDQVATHRDSKSLVVMGKAPQFSLTDQHDNKICNENFSNQVYVVEFFFSSCTSICPKMNKNMKEVEKQFFGNPHFSIVSVSIDPDHDTSKVLLQHAQDLGVKSKQWHFLTGNYNSIMDLANKGFNVYAGKNPNISGGFEHSGLFALVDKKGNIRCRKDSFGNPILYYDGLEKKGIKDLIQDIQLLLNE